MTGSNHHAFTSDYIRKFLGSIDSPRALTCWLLFSNGEHDQLVNLEFNPQDYNSVRSASDALLATKFLSKAEFLSTTVDRRSVALAKFYEAEAQCKAANSRILTSRYSNVLTAEIVFQSRRKIEKILGDFNPDELIDACNWGPGATTLIRRRNSVTPIKYQSETGITVAAYDFCKSWFHIAYPFWDKNQLPSGIHNGKNTFLKNYSTIENSSKIVTVPKNAKTDRTIGIEPGLNLWFQKGIGTMIRRRLLRAGIDLNKQSINGNLSRIAAKFNHLATVDFSSASDTISYRLVEEILPSKWFFVLKAFRSSFYSLDGHISEFEKFSSMGNGFTFELESLIFFAIAHSVCDQIGAEGSISVYGDDVILPSIAFDMYSSICADVGFTVNVRKSYSSTYYRESCGSHFWNGTDIKPIFQKELLDGKTAIIKAANNVRRLAHRRNANYGCDWAFRHCWRFLQLSLGTSVPVISDGFGDIGLVVNYDEAVSLKAITKPKYGIEGYYVKIWAVIAHQKNFDEWGTLASKLWSISTSDGEIRPDVSSVGNQFPMPGRTKHAKVRMLIPRWYFLGPWI